MDYTIGVMTQGESPGDIIGIAVHPGAAALIHLGVALVIEAYERDPEATLARLADVAARCDEPVSIPSELLSGGE
jgi:hypothetical protein